MTTRIEAENTSLSGAYFVESASYASNGSVVRLDSTPGSTGTCTHTWTGASGTYDIDFMYVAENDGQATMSLSVAGSVVDSWLFVLGSTSRDPTLRQITGVSISTGDAIVIEGIIDAGCNARWDYMDLTLVSGGYTIIYPNGEALSVASEIVSTSIGSQFKEVFSSIASTVAPEITQFTLQLLRVFNSGAVSVSNEITQALIKHLLFFDASATVLSSEISGYLIDSRRIFTGSANSTTSEVDGIIDQIPISAVFESITTSLSSEISPTSLTTRIELEEQMLSAGLGVNPNPFPNVYPSNQYGTVFTSSVEVGGVETCTFSWAKRSGFYNIELLYRDIIDDFTEVRIEVDGNIIDSWFFGQGGGSAIRSIPNVALSTGSVITVFVTKTVTTSLGRMDYMDFTYVAPFAYFNSITTTIAREISQTSLDTLRIFSSAASTQANEIIQSLLQTTRVFASTSSSAAGEILGTSLQSVKIFQSVSTTLAEEILETHINHILVFTSLSLSESNEILEVLINSKRSFSSNAITQAGLRMPGLINKLRLFTTDANTLAVEITQVSDNSIFNSNASSVASEIQGTIDTLKVFSSLATSINSAVTSSRVNSLRNFYSLANTSSSLVSFSKILLFNASTATITSPVYTVLHPIGVQPYGSIKYRSAPVYQTVIWSGDLVPLAFEVTGSRISDMNLIFIVKNISCSQEIFKQVNLNSQNIHIKEVQSNIDESTTYKGQIYLTTTETLTQESQELNYLLTLENYFNRYIIEKGRFFIKPKKYAAI